MKKFQDFAARNKKKVILAAVIAAAVIVFCICLAAGLGKGRQDALDQKEQITSQISRDDTETTEPSQKEDKKAASDQAEQKADEKETKQDQAAAKDPKKTADTDKKAVSDQTKAAASAKTSSDKNSSKKSSASGSDTAKSSGSSKSSKTSSKSSSTSSKSSNSSKSGTSSKSDASGSSQSVKPAHQHSWKAHKVRVTNTVTVVDEPEHVVYGAQLYTKQADGTWLSNGKTYWFENGFTIDDLKDILIDKIKNEGYIGNYVNRQKTVPAVTHKEEQISYKTDYYYCSCGAVKK